MGTTLVARQNVDFVHNNGLHILQCAGRLGGQHQIEGFGGGDQNIRGMGGQGPAAAGVGVSGADARPDLGCFSSLLFKSLGDAVQRSLQVAGHIRPQGLHGRDVKHGDPRFTGLLGPGHELVDGPKKGGQGLARPGGRNDQRIAA